MKKYPFVFSFIANEFKKTNVKYVLIGGFAVNHYGFTRQTADVNFLITKEDVNIIKEILKKVGYEMAKVQDDVFVRFEIKNSPYLMDIDFMLIDNDTICQIIKEGKKIKISGNNFKIPSIKHLIALKLHSIKFNPKIREFRDLPDIINLLRINKGLITKKQLHDLCLKYGTEEIYEKIKIASY